MKYRGTKIEKINTAKQNRGKKFLQSDEKKEASGSTFTGLKFQFSLQ